MPRSDPFFKIFVTMPRHPKTIRIWPDNTMLACYVRVGIALIEHFADRTDDQMVVGPKELREIAATEQVSGAVQRLKKLASLSPVEFLDPSIGRDVVEIRSGCRPVVAEVSPSTPKVWVLGLPNFAEKQGFGERKSKQRAPSESESEAATKEKKKRESPPPENANEWEGMERIRAWAAKKQPWANGQLDDLITACFLHFKSEGKKKVDWYAAAQKWVIRERGYMEERKRDKPHPHGSILAAREMLLEQSARRHAGRYPDPAVRLIPEAGESGADDVGLPRGPR